MTAQPRPVAIARPSTDPTADLKTDLRHARQRHEDAKLELALAYQQLGDCIRAARDGGLAYSQIARVLAKPVMTVYDHAEGKRTRVPKFTDPTSPRARARAAKLAADRKARNDRNCP